MNSIGKALLNVMRIEVLLGIGLVLWVMSIEARAEEQVCLVIAGSVIEGSRIDNCKKNDVLIIAPVLGENNHRHSEYIARVCALETIVRLEDTEVPRILCRYTGKVLKRRYN